MPTKTILRPAFNSRGRRCGAYVQDPDDRIWLEKSVRQQLHHLHTPPSWACDVALIEELRGMGGRGIRLFVDHVVVLEATLDAIDRFGFPVRRQHGEQVGLIDAHWAVHGVPHAASGPTKPPSPPTAPLAAQLSLPLLTPVEAISPPRRQRTEKAA